MSEPGIGSIEMFLFCYFCVGFVIVLLWCAFASIVLDEIPDAAMERRLRRRRRAGRLLAVCGVLHAGFALLAHDVASFHSERWPPVDERARQRAMTEAKLCGVGGAVVFAVATMGYAG